MRQSRAVVFGEEDGYTYVTVKTEVTIVIHDPDDLEGVDLADLLPPAPPLLRSPRRDAGRPAGPE